RPWTSFRAFLNSTMVPGKRQGRAIHGMPPCMMYWQACHCHELEPSQAMCRRAEILDTTLEVLASESVAEKTRWEVSRLCVVYGLQLVPSFVQGAVITVATSC